MKIDPGCDYETGDDGNVDDNDNDGDTTPAMGRIQSARRRKLKEVPVTILFTPTGEKMPEH